MKKYQNIMDVLEKELNRRGAKEKELTRAYAEMCIINRQLRDEIDKLNKLMGSKA